MSRWTQFFALALACWLPLQSALAWLPVQLPASANPAPLDQSRPPSLVHDAMAHEPASHGASLADAHGAMPGCDMSDAEMASSLSPSHAQVNAAAAACTGSGCDTQQLPGMLLGHHHCGACVPVLGALLDTVIVSDFGLRPSQERLEWHSPRYINFVPGIPSPPPCHQSV